MIYLLVYLIIKVWYIFLCKYVVKYSNRDKVSDEQPLTTNGSDEQPMTTHGSDEQPMTTHGSDEQPITTHGSDEQPMTMAF